MISHRLASITACDRIFIWKNGSITEQGTHQELMEKQGKYAKAVSGAVKLIVY